MRERSHGILNHPFVAALVCLACVAGGQDFGGVSTRNHRALSLPFLRIEPAFGVLSKARSGWDISWTIANDIRREPQSGPLIVEEDQETSRVLLRRRQGTGWGEWFAELPLLSRGGGFLDRIIDGWHANVLGWTDPLRDSTPFGRSRVFVSGSGEFGSAAGIGDAVFGAKLPFDHNLELTAAVKLPTGDAGSLLGSGAIDAAASIAWLMKINARWHSVVQLGLVAQGKPTRLRNARGLVDQESLAVVYRPNSKDQWSVQWQGESSALNSGSASSDAPHRLVTFGYRRRISSTQWLEGFFSEDRDLVSGSVPEVANVGPDFTAGLRLLIRL